ncbi:filamentation induced by cAMP protein Fic (plasmid) [Rhizobium favelukesii]|uniref:Filamentation induced by cAMP protein Fic n=2 Tax=Rhizobium/Agrobacterium group TaxID=227290 RepID=W6RI52_9HYPH|nr:filamentation induced by cAMP protein Fic [Rhizobium favelukesii]
MHPVLLVPELQGLEKNVYDTLARRGGSGLSQAKIIQLLELRPSSQSSVSRALAKLGASGLVEKSGTTRDASFNLTSEARWFSVPSHLRPHVNYDPMRFRSYDTDAGPWLDPAARALMADSVGQGGLDLDPSTYTREIAERFLIEMSWASSALEGNTYSLPETEALIKYAEVAGGKSEVEVQMILNHKQAIGWVIDNIATAQITSETVMRLHAMLMRTLVRQNNLGAVRRDPVSITTSSYSPSSDHAELSMGLSELCWKASMTRDPFEASFALLAGIAYLQPFIDGNKRTGRLLSNIPLLKAGLPPISFVGVGRAAYGIGMTTWYELADTKYLSKAISEGYAITAPSYLVAATTKRVPRSIEIRMRRRLDDAVAEYLNRAVDDPAMTPDDFATEAFADIEGEDFDVIVQSFSDIIESISEVNCVAYGVEPDLVERYHEAKAGGGPAHR